MRIINIYEYKSSSDGRATTIVSPNIPEEPYKQLYRLVADDGKILTNGTAFTYVVDADSPDDWREVDEQ